MSGCGWLTLILHADALRADKRSEGRVCALTKMPLRRAHDAKTSGAHGDIVCGM